MSQLEYEIYDILSTTIEDQSIIEMIYDKIDAFKDETIEPYLTEIKTIKKQVINLDNKVYSLQCKLIQLKDKIVLIEDTYEYEKKQNILLKNANKYLTVFRSALNSVFHKYWIMYENEIEDLDYDELCKDLKYKNLDSDGFKYAIARINGNCEGLSMELCKLYLEMNKLFHSKLKSISVVEESISKIKELLENENIPDYYVSIGLTLDIMNEFEIIIKTNSDLLN
jgi:hypothetical protein